MVILDQSMPGGTAEPYHLGTACLDTSITVCLKWLDGALKHTGRPWLTCNCACDMPLTFLAGDTLVHE